MVTSAHLTHTLNAHTQKSVLIPDMKLNNCVGVLPWEGLDITAVGKSHWRRIVIWYNQCGQSMSDKPEYTSKPIEEVELKQRRLMFGFISSR